MKKDYNNKFFGRGCSSAAPKRGCGIGPACKLLLFAVVALGLVSCSKDFLNRGSKIVFSDENFWTSEGNVKS